MVCHAVAHRSSPVRSSMASATRSSPGLPHMSSSVSWSGSTTTSPASRSASSVGRRQQPGDQRDPALAHPHARSRPAELGASTVALDHLGRQPRIVVARLVQPRLGEPPEREQHPGGAEVDAVDRGGRLAVAVERMPRPPVLCAQRFVRVARDRSDRLLDRARRPSDVRQRLVHARVEEHARTLRAPPIGLPVRPMCEHTFVRWDNLTIEAQEEPPSPATASPRSSATSTRRRRWTPVSTRSGPNPRSTASPSARACPSAGPSTPTGDAAMRASTAAGARRRFSWPMGGPGCSHTCHPVTASWAPKCAGGIAATSPRRCSRTGRRSSPHIASRSRTAPSSSQAAITAS